MHFVRSRQRCDPNFLRRGGPSEAGPDPRWVKTRYQYEIWVDPSDYLQGLLYYLGTFEPHVQQLIIECLPVGGTFIDVA